MIGRILLLALAFGLGTEIHAAEMHVAPDGKNTATGAADAPLRTIQAALDRAAPGDSLIIHTGTYREAAVVTRGGLPNRPVRIKAAQGERVVIDGTEPVAGRWRAGKDGTWSTKVTGPVEQVFLDGAMLVEARWPNMRFPADLWKRSCWAAAAPGSDKGLMVDSKLAETGVDWTGANAMLNVSHQFWTWTCPVIRHEAGAERFTYDVSKASGMRDATGHIRYDDDYYYLFGMRAALDVPGEWFHDAAAGRLHVIPPDGQPVGRLTVRIKRRNFGLTLRDVKHVEVHGLHFFGCAFRIDGDHCTIADCHATFPSYNRIVVERQGRGSPCATLAGDDNRLERSSLAFASGNGLSVRGDRNSVDNNLIHDVCWSGSLDYAAIRVTGQENVIRRNTVFNSGNLLISHGGGPNVIELNHVHDGGWACRDLSMVYSVTPRAGGSVVRRNWVHGCHAPHLAMGIRADDKSRDITIHHNVVWGCGWEGVVCKGDRHRVFHNTVFDNGRSDLLLYVGPEQDKDWQKQWKAIADQNANSMIYNNAVQSMCGNRQHPEVRPGGEKVGNFEADDLKQHLRAPDRLDFRPKPRSPLVDRGRPVPGHAIPFHGKAADAGAYELGGEYWVPGITWQPKDVLGADPAGYVPTNQLVE